jgi:isopenicillin-N epimerase
MTEKRYVLIFLVIIMQKEIIFGKNLLSNWYLDPEITFLNHASFGAAPRVVIESLKKWNEIAERQPLHFFLDEYFGLIRQRADLLAEFLKTKGENIAFVENATTGANTILHSLITTLKTSDEILFTDQVYPAVRNAVIHINKITNSSHREIKIPLPVTGKEEIIDIIEKSLSDKTKLFILDHISSPTGIIFPAKEICEICRNRGILTLVDGAHAPGSIELNIEEINPDWYTGNCHKWLFTPKGCAFLWTNNKNFETTRPLVISLFYGQGYQKEFDWTGTKNPASWLSLDTSLNFYNSFGKDNIINYIHNLIVEARNLICNEFDAVKIAPDNMIGSIAAIPVPIKNKNFNFFTTDLRRKILKEFSIEVPFTNMGDIIFIRPCAQIYNEIGDYKKLISCLQILLND